MTINWDELTEILGERRDSTKFALFVANIGEEPEISETSEDYNDPLGRTIFYKYTSSGMEMGFRQGALNHVHLFLQPGEGYERYVGSLEGGLDGSASEEVVRKFFGEPTLAGGGKPSLLLGFRHRWIKYSRVDHSVRYEFIPNNGLRKVSLITE